MSVSKNIESKKEAGFELLLPMIVPIVIFAAVTLFFVVSADNAFKANLCYIYVPWGSDITEAVLRNIFVAPWNEVQQLRRLGLKCSATLHADLTSVFALTALPAVLSGIVVIPYSGISKLWLRDESRHIEIILKFAFVFFMLSGFYVLYINLSGFIYFGGKQIAYRLLLKDSYINLYAYWFWQQLVFVNLSFGLWFGYCAVSLIRSYRIKRRQLSLEKV